MEGTFFTFFNTFPALFAVLSILLDTFFTPSSNLLISLVNPFTDLLATSFDLFATILGTFDTSDKAFPALLPASFTRFTKLFTFFSTFFILLNAFFISLKAFLILI